MLRQLDFRQLNKNDWTLPRAAVDVMSVMPTVQTVCEDVRVRGIQAVLDYSEKFDSVRPEFLRVEVEALHAALDDLDPSLITALEESIHRLRITCEAELAADVVTVVADGASVESRQVPIQRVGLYVPGGLAPLLSTVVMNVVPAQVAGVRSIALASPPQSNGLPNPGVMAACALLGVDEVYAVGGAQALAMLAYGTEINDPVDLITGPGNIYVAAAKRHLQGTVAIDAEAGPTEIMVLADESANPRFLAADLISQAEHDPLAASVLVTDSQNLIDLVSLELERQVPLTQHAERVRTAFSGQQSAFVLVADMNQGLEVVNAYGAEHLEIQTRDAAQLSERVHNAGVIFLGDYAPVSLGDYVAGSNHVLPTGGSSARSSGLSVKTFTRTMHVVNYTRDALAAVAEHAVTLAQAEDLPGHGDAVDIRLT